MFVVRACHTNFMCSYAAKLDLYNLKNIFYFIFVPPLNLHYRFKYLTNKKITLKMLFIKNSKIIIACNFA